LFDEYPIMHGTLNVVMLDATENNEFVEFLLRHIDGGDYLHGLSLLDLNSLNMENGEFCAEVKTETEASSVLSLVSHYPDIVSFTRAARLPGDPPRVGFMKVQPRAHVVTDAGDRVHSVCCGRPSSGDDSFRYIVRDDRDPDNADGESNEPPLPPTLLPVLRQARYRARERGAPRVTAMDVNEAAVDLGAPRLHMRWSLIFQSAEATMAFWRCGRLAPEKSLLSAATFRQMQMTGEVTPPAMSVTLAIRAVPAIAEVRR
jgi:hypothetical protein